MPPENRSSNTEMVSVPRALAERISNICMFTMYKEDWRALSEILAKPADQHQGEPVHVVRSHGSCCWEEASGEGLDICLSMPEEYEVRKLYTHADPGEVERLQVELTEAKADASRARLGHRQLCAKHAEILAERDTLREELASETARADAAVGDANEAESKLAERDALLRDFCAHSALICGDLLRLAREDDCATTEPIRARAYAAMDHSRKVKKALSASAEPSAPVERDDLTSMVDAAMVEMAGIHPPLKRSECERLIRAALERKP